MNMKKNIQKNRGNKMNNDMQTNGGHIDMKKAELLIYLIVILPAGILYQLGSQYFYLYIAILIAGTQFLLSDNFLNEYNIKINKKLLRQYRSDITNLSISVLIAELLFNYPMTHWIDHLAKINAHNGFQLFISRMFQSITILLLALPICALLKSFWKYCAKTFKRIF